MTRDYDSIGPWVLGSLFLLLCVIFWPVILLFRVTLVFCERYAWCWKIKRWWYYRTTR